MFFGRGLIYSFIFSGYSLKHSRPSVKFAERQDLILQTLAEMLEHSSRRSSITIKALAIRLGISESSIYRCFPNKSHMFEALIVFIEKTVFGLINHILQEEHPGINKVENVLLLLLGFVRKNPGMTRILIGEVLIKENAYLQPRIDQLHDRLEATLKQAMRFAISEQQITTPIDVAAQANVLMCFVIGRWYQFVHSQFQLDPLANWEKQRLMVLPDELLARDSTTSDSVSV